MTVSRESCSDAVREAHEVLSRIVDVENALMQPRISLLSTLINTVILAVATILSASLAFLGGIISRDSTVSSGTGMCVVFVVFIVFIVLYIWIQRRLKKFLSEERGRIERYGGDLEGVLRGYKELYEGYSSTMNTCYEALCGGDGMDALCAELRILKNMELTVGGDP